MQRNIQVKYRIYEMALRLNEDKEVIENGVVYQLKEWHILNHKINCIIIEALLSVKP